MTIYKVCTQEAWREAARLGRFEGAPVDLADGYVHFSLGSQLAETLRRHFAGQQDLLLISVDEAKLGPALRMEPSRGGALFPHLYGALPLSAVTEVESLRLGADGSHILPPGTDFGEG